MHVAGANNEEIRRSLRSAAGPAPSWLGRPAPGTLRLQISEFSDPDSGAYCSLLINLVDRMPGTQSNYEVEDLIRTVADQAPELDVGSLRFDSESDAFGVTCPSGRRDTLEALCDLIDQIWPAR